MSSGFEQMLLSKILAKQGIAGESEVGYKDFVAIGQEAVEYHPKRLTTTWRSRSGTGYA